MSGKSPGDMRKIGSLPSLAGARTMLKPLDLTVPLGVPGSRLATREKRLYTMRATIPAATGAPSVIGAFEGHPV